MRRRLILESHSRQPEYLGPMARGRPASSNRTGATMDIRIRLGFLVLLGAVVPGVSGHAQAKLPAGVTPEMVDKGKAIFTGAGNCYACHGQNAQGMLGPTTNLTDATWVHSDGSFPKI